MKKILILFSLLLFSACADTEEIIKSNNNDNVVDNQTNINNDTENNSSENSNAETGNGNNNNDNSITEISNGNNDNSSTEISNENNDNNSTEISDENNDNSSTEISNENNDNKPIDSSIFLYQLQKGNNKILDYSKDKMLITSVYFNDKNNTENTNAYFTINGNITPAIQQTNFYNYYQKINKEISEKEKFKQYLAGIEKEISESNIKPINPYYKNQYSLKTVPENITVGTKWNNVYIATMDGGSRPYNVVNATCIAVSKYAYFFLQDGLSNLTEEQIKDITSSFDKDYDIVHRYFDKENDIDNNGKIIFLIGQLPKGVMGFFFNLDKYPNTRLHYSQQYSNEADILYVNHSYFQKDIWKTERTNVIATFIHEFQHMTFFDTRSRLGLNSNNARWLNEGLSMLSEYYGGYGKAHNNYIKGYFFRNQGLPLVTENQGLDYGLELLFTKYLRARCGDNFIKTIYTSSSIGKKAVEEACKVDFDLLFEDFVKMVTVTGRNITTDKRYNIDDFNYPKGSVGYTKNGFNIGEIINEVYSLNSKDQKFITQKGYSTSLFNYSFILTKWQANQNNINFETDNPNMKGIYTAW